MNKSYQHLILMLIHFISKKDKLNNKTFTLEKLTALILFWTILTPLSI